MLVIGTRRCEGVRAQVGGVGGRWRGHGCQVRQRDVAGREGVEGRKKGLFEIRLEYRHWQGGDYSNAEAPSELRVDVFSGVLKRIGAGRGARDGYSQRLLMAGSIGVRLGMMLPLAWPGRLAAQRKASVGAHRFGSVIRKPTGVGAQAENRVGTRAAASKRHGYWLPNERWCGRLCLSQVEDPQITLEPARPCDGEHVWRSTGRLIWSLFVGSFLSCFRLLDLVRRGGGFSAGD